MFFFHPKKGPFLPHQDLGLGYLEDTVKGIQGAKKRFMPSLGAIFIFGQTFLILENTKYKGCDECSP